MKIYKPKKWLVVVRVISLFSLMLLLGTTVLDTSYSVNINNVNLNKSLEVAVMEENHENLYVAELYDAEATFTGDLTAYVGDCPLCSGILACHPRTNVLESGIYFNDSEYGQVRIVATSSKYSCGTILRFNVDKIGEEPIIAIAMDRGVGGNNVDLLVDDVNYATRNIGRVKDQTFEVLRYGW